MSTPFAVSFLSARVFCCGVPRDIPTDSHSPFLLKTLPLELYQFRLKNVVYFHKGDLYTALAVHATSSPLSSVQDTMIQDSARYRVLNISELARHIASHLVLINAEGSAVNLACACRSLEEPILSTLWDKQSSLCTLLEVLPEENRVSHPIQYPVCGLDPQLEGLKA